MSMVELNNYMVEMVYEYIPHIKRVGSNKLNFKCPLCGDGKKSTSHRGWFYIDTGTYYCWNAGCIASDHGMSGIQFLSLISGKSPREIKIELFKNSGFFQNKPNTQINNKIALFDDEEESKNKSGSVMDKIDNGEWKTELPKSVNDYIANRKLLKAPYIPNDFHFYFDIKHTRLVIPWTSEYYQERIILDSQKNESKYMFPSNIKKPIFGLNMIDPNFKYIFLLEGVFDSIWVKNGLAIGSLHLSNYQKDLLKEYKNDYTIVYMPDNQRVDKSARETTIKLCKENPFEKIFLWPEQLNKFKDVNESVIYSDKLIDIWKSEKFLTDNICNGVKGILELNNI